jgi:hypothetical protein
MSCQQGAYNRYEQQEEKDRGAAAADASEDAGHIAQDASVIRLRCSHRS